MTNTHPSITKVSALTETFLKQAHKVMKDKGYKMSSFISSASIEYVYEKEDSRKVTIVGWHGRKGYDTGKAVFDILVEDSNSTYTEPDFRIFDVNEVLSNKVGQQMLPEQNVNKYERNLKGALDFLKNVEKYIEGLESIKA